MKFLRSAVAAVCAGVIVHGARLRNLDGVAPSACSFTTDESTCDCEENVFDRERTITQVGETCEVTPDDREIMIKVPGSSKILTLCEVRVYMDDGATEMLELHSATQSSTGWGGLAELAYDNEASMNYFSPSARHCTHTNQETDPWWKAKIRSPQWIKKIRLYTRTDCCQNRIDGAEVYIDEVLVGTVTANTANTNEAQTYEFTVDIAGVQQDTVQCECPVHCETTLISDWGACSAECGGGTQTREYEITQQPNESGDPCPDSLIESQDCNMQDCPVHCETALISDWGACSAECGGGTQTREYEITQQPNEFGDPCPDSLIESQDCNTQDCPVHCEVALKSDWGACSVECGGGTQTREYEVTQEPNEYGDACPDLIESQECNTQDCPVHCEVALKSDWSPCSKVCGGGMQSREFEVTQEPNEYGDACPDLYEERACNEADCICNSRVVVGIDYSYHNKGRSEVQRRYALAQLKASLDNLGQAIHDDRAHMSLMKVLPTETSIEVSLDDAESGSNEALSEAVVEMIENDRALEVKNTDFEGFFALALQEVAKDGPEYRQVVLLMTDGFPPNTNRKQLIALYDRIDAVLNVPNKPFIICYRPNTWAAWTNLLDKYCDVYWTQQEGEKEEKNRYVIGAEIANFICPKISNVEDVNDIDEQQQDIEANAIENPCESKTEKKECLAVRKDSDGSDPEPGKAGFGFCQWNKKASSCIVKKKYAPLFEEEEDNTDQSNETDGANSAPVVLPEDPCPVFVQKKPCVKSKAAVNSKRISVCQWSGATGCELKDHYQGYFSSSP